ncbi:MAG: hypothetical protein WC455_18265 [Dehalococcoidia bacterium]|jgi:hypothetical protein
MTTISLYDISEAIENTFTAAGVFARVQTNETITDGMQTVVTLQIYPEEITGDTKTRTDRMTMGGGVRHTEVIYHVDVYALQHANIGQDMKAIALAADKVIAVLEAQDATPPFGLAGLKSFRWNARRVLFELGDAQVKYAGLRFVLTFSIF